MAGAAARICSAFLLLALLQLPSTATALENSAEDEGHEHFFVHLYDLLMLNPFGVKIERPQAPPPPPPPVTCPSPLPTDQATLGGQGDVSVWTCSVTGYEVGTVCNGTCDIISSNGANPKYQATCQANGDWKYGTVTGEPVGIACSKTCFSGDSRVVVRGRPEGTMAIRDVRVGDYVMCFEGGPDLSSPGEPRWCQVQSFSRAEEVEFRDMARITLKGNDGQRYTTTVSWLHLMHVITHVTHKDAAAAASAEQLGPFEVDAAVNLKPGQMMAVASALNLTATFTAAVIESVEPVSAMGKYQPSIDSPYILVDGVVMPLWASWFKQEHLEGGAIRATSAIVLREQNTIKHYFNSPLWMARKQPEGTPGLHAQWDGKPRSPHSAALGNMVERNTGVAGLNFTRAKEWFMPRYQAWLQDPSKAITEAEALEAFPLMFDPVNPSTADQPVADSTCTTHLSTANPAAKPMALLIDRWGKAHELLEGVYAGTCSLV